MVSGSSEFETWPWLFLDMFLMFPWALFFSSINRGRAYLPHRVVLRITKGPGYSVHVPFPPFLLSLSLAGHHLSVFCLSPVFISLFPYYYHIEKHIFKHLLWHLIFYLEFKLVLYIVFSMNIYVYNRSEGWDVVMGLLCFGSWVMGWMVKWIIQCVCLKHQEEKELGWERLIEPANIWSRSLKKMLTFLNGLRTLMWELHGTHAVGGKLPRILLWSDHGTHHLDSSVSKSLLGHCKFEHLWSSWFPRCDGKSGFIRMALHLLFCPCPRNAGAGLFFSKLPAHVLSWHRSL